MAEPARLICDSAELADGGDGIRFELGPEGGPVIPAFAVRIGGVARAFVNRCAHVPVELDWMPGRFLDFDRRFIICATHGALYEPTTGRCVAGPCKGASLEILQVFEREGKLYLRLPAP